MTERDDQDPIEAGLRRLNITLSPLLRYVLVMVCAGKTDEQIAEAVYVSTRTAGNYLRRLFKVTKTTNRTALVAEVLGGLNGIRSAEKLAAKAWRKDTATVPRARP